MLGTHCARDVLTLFDLGESRRSHRKGSNLTRAKDCELPQDQKCFWNNLTCFKPLSLCLAIQVNNILPQTPPFQTL